MNATKWILLLVLAALPSTAVAQTAEEFFDSQTLHDLELFIHERDLAEMLERYTEPLYFPADFQWRGARVRNVAVRIRGLATRSRIKPGLRIDFNRYVDGQQFLGLNALVLDNALTDPSFVRERTSMAFIAKMGGAAPRESFARVFVNGTFVGLYAVVEAVDAKFLTRTLGDGSGYLFEHRYLGGFHSEYLGRDLASYKARFEAETHQLEADTLVYGPVHDLFYEINQDVDAVWRERVSRFVDLPQLVRYVAIEMFLNEIDGFLGGAGMANFFLYRPAGSQVHRVLPWDRDSTFQNSEESVFTRVQDNELFRRALAFDDLRTLYLDVLAECARVASDGRWLENAIIQMHMVINDAVYQDPLKPFSYEEYNRHINYLLWFAQRRPVVVMDEVNRSR